MTENTSLPPYGQIAPIYDILMSEVDYKSWAEYILKLLERTGIKPGQSLLDLACGTGTMSLLLARAGYQVAGIDLSPEMLKVARQKSKEQNLALEYFQGDLRTFKAGSNYNVITCFFDGINYLLTSEDVAACFTSVYQTLAHGGAFIFDVNTIHALSRFWGNNTEMREDQGVISVWNNRYLPASNSSELTLTAFVPRGGLYEKLAERHTERAYPLEELKQALIKTGFFQVECFRQNSQEQPSEDTKRVTFLTRKP
ncbi:class I SAM-dependent methyltransferase [candidate division TA06 bacterium]|uniref:Class I SAM-dependent methyltransferase n=1 Tax=candidate division TA06 bacterium TaxID=2250710 RepID=A0A933IBC3_UNCT6|nr:class I SAM-dependent methyltransferase [candidate division TA06 bacterium]